jgi:hypothetical protein
LRLFQNDEEVKQADYIRVVRNLIVHKRGFVDRKFLSDVPDRKGKEQLGMKVEIDDGFLESLYLLDRTVDEIDRRVAKKYKLAQPITDKGFWQAIAQIRQMATAEPPPAETEGGADHNGQASSVS